MGKGVSGVAPEPNPLHSGLSWADSATRRNLWPPVTWIHMGRLATILPLLTVLCAQMPWMSCASDCQQSVIPLVGAPQHSCHETGEAPNEHCACCRPDEPEEEPEGGEHNLFSYQLLVHGDACVLEVPAISHALPPIRADHQGCPLSDDRVEAVQDPPLVPIERAACIALLL